MPAFSFSNERIIQLDPDIIPATEHDPVASILCKLRKQRTILANALNQASQTSIAYKNKQQLIEKIDNIALRTLRLDKQEIQNLKDSDIQAYYNLLPGLSSFKSFRKKVNEAVGILNNFSSINYENKLNLKPLVENVQKEGYALVTQLINDSDANDLKSFKPIDLDFLIATSQATQRIVNNPLDQTAISNLTKMVQETKVPFNNYVKAVGHFIAATMLIGISLIIIPLTVMPPLAFFTEQIINYIHDPLFETVGSQFKKGSTLFKSTYSKRSILNSEKKALREIQKFAKDDERAKSSRP